MTIRLLAVAQAELDDAINWYDAQAPRAARFWWNPSKFSASLSNTRTLGIH
jgi:hypothetical protein